MQFFIYFSYQFFYFVHSLFFLLVHPFMFSNLYWQKNSEEIIKKAEVGITECSY